MIPAAVDIAAGCVLVASLLAPLTPLIALAIKLDSPGPVFSRQQDPLPAFFCRNGQNVALHRHCLTQPVISCLNLRALKRL